MDGDEKKVEQAVTQETFYRHRIDYERRHGELAERVTRLESVILNLATKQDLERLKTEIIKELSESIATRTDVDWLKRAYWVSVGALSSAMLGIVAIVVSHVTGKTP